MDSKLKLVGPAQKLHNNLKDSGIHNLNRILASQNRFQSLYDEIFNINRLQSSNPFSMRLKGILIILILVNKMS